MKFTGFNSILIILSPLLALSLFINGCAVTGDENTLLKVSPESVVVTFGGSKPFSVSPAGTTVTWSVNGILGGNEGTVGTIDSDGTYTAPAGAGSAPEKVIVRAEDSNGIKGSAVAFLTTFKSNKRLTTHYTAGISRANTYSSGQKNIAVFKESGTGDVNVYAVWSDKSSGQYKVYLSRSGDGGVSFDDPVPVDDTSSGEQISPAIAADDNGDVFIVWEDHGQGDADIFVRKYISATGVFESKKQINPDTNGSTDYDTTPSIDVSADEIYITWEHRENSGDNYPEIYYAWSSDLGDTFSVRSSVSVSGRRPVVAIGPDDNAYVAWEDLGVIVQFPYVPTKIKIAKISAGTAGAVLDIEAESGYNARYPSIAVDPVCTTSCKVYVVWQRALISEQKFVGEITTSYHIDLAIVDGGTMTSPGYTRSVTDSGSSGFAGGWAYPAIAVDNSYIYLVWDDWRNGVKDIYFARSSNGTDFTTNRIVNDDMNNSSLVAWHEKPGIAVADGKAYVIWTDYRNTQSSTTASPNDVYFAVER